jgi:RNA polymerase sigma-70 factor (ECF subfamily)
LSSEFRDVAENAEARAIEEAKNGSAEAFEVLYHAHKRRIYSLCLRMTGNPAEAEDLTQEAFLQVFRKIGTFRGEAAFSTWMHRLAVNLVLMKLRKKGILTSSLEEPIESDSGDSRQREFGSDDMALSGSVDRVALQRAIGALPTGYRTVFELHDVQGYEHKEIAKMIGCSVGNSKSQLHKARLKLRDLLQGEIASNAGEFPEVSGGLEEARSTNTAGSDGP